MSWFRSRRGLVALLGILLLTLFAIRPSVGGLRSRIAHSISIALGRQVEISSASLRLLPQPGFDLGNFIVYDDPDFSLEPVLRSDAVTASLRIISLLRGRLEIARLSLSEPSLNLVRNSSGHWNLEYLLERTARTPVAPTGKAPGEARPGFPYIEANGGRINFKLGMEKKQFALTEASFALFQDSENSWGARLEAKPVRTDANSSDTGLLKMVGSWQRAQALRETPLRFAVQWERAQIGQASNLIYGNDKGWRGVAAISAEVSGTPASLSILSEATVEDFRRYDILAGTPMRLRAQCGGHFSSTTQSLSNIICESPVGNGAITLHGDLAVFPSPVYHLAVFAQDVPLQSLISLARHSKKDIPDDLVAAGTLNWAIKTQREKADEKTTTTWEGGGETSEFRLASQFAPSQLSLPKIQFSISSAILNIDRKKRRRTSHESVPNPGETRLNISPFTVALGEPVPATVRGWFSRSGYNLTIDGDAQLRRLLRAAQTVGIPAPKFNADGKARFELQIAGTWEGFKAPRVTGKADLSAIRAEVRGLNAPLEIDAAEILLGPEQVNVQSLSASLVGETWHGSLAMPRPCAGMGNCPIQFDLHADEVATDDLDKLLNPQYAKAPWYRFLMASQGGSPALLTLRATGRLSADRVLIHKLNGSQVSASATFDRGKLYLTNIRGGVLGGTHMGDWTVDFTARPPSYNGEGSFQRVALGQLASAMHDNWISGTATATYHATASGSSAAELFSSATGILKIEAHDGFLPHLRSPNLVGPLQLRHFEGKLTLRHQELDFGEAKLMANGANYDVTGTATFGRALNLKLVRGSAGGFNVTGTLSAPVVSRAPASETSAALKP